MGVSEADSLGFEDILSCEVLLRASSLGGVVRKLVFEDVNEKHD